jgi:hypothetical protein
METRIDLETTFAQFVRAHGDEVVEDIVGKSPDFFNADYLLRGRTVVAELKRLAEDKSQDAALRAQLDAKFREWMDRRLIGPIYGTVQINSKTLPLECQRDLLALFAKPLKTHIRKANAQIKRTIEEFDIPTAQGLLIIANDGNYALEADAALYLIGKILGKQHHRINSVIYFTANLYVHTPLTPQPAILWVHANRPGLTAVNPTFIDALFSHWRRYLARIIGREIRLVEIPQGQAFSEIRLQRNRS